MIKVEGSPKSRYGLGGRKATLDLVLAFARPVNHTVSPRSANTKKPVSSRVVTSSQSAQPRRSDYTKEPVLG